MVPSSQAAAQNTELATSNKMALGSTCLHNMLPCFEQVNFAAPTGRFSALALPIHLILTFFRDWILTFINESLLINITS
jgi:hypothetical protein